MTKLFRSGKYFDSAPKESRVETRERGDWGTSKAYVIGLAFAAMGFSSLLIIIAVCVLTFLVGLNYIVVCRENGVSQRFLTQK